MPWLVPVGRHRAEPQPVPPALRGWRNAKSVQRSETSLWPDIIFFQDLAETVPTAEVMNVEHEKSPLRQQL